MRKLPLVFAALSSAAGVASAAEKSDRAFFGVVGLVLGYGVGSFFSDVEDITAPDKQPELEPEPESK